MNKGFIIVEPHVPNEMLKSKAAPARPTHTMPPELQSPRAKLVYLYLTTNDGATVGEMSDFLGMKKIALYGVLKTLRKRGMIAREDGTYTLA